MTEKRLPTGLVVSYGYDANGNLVREADNLGAETSYRYDAENRLVSTTYSDGFALAYTYDICL